MTLMWLDSQYINKDNTPKLEIFYHVMLAQYNIFPTCQLNSDEY